MNQSDERLLAALAKAAGRHVKESNEMIAALARWAEQHLRDLMPLSPLIVRYRAATRKLCIARLWALPRCAHVEDVWSFYDHAKLWYPIQSALL